MGQNPTKTELEINLEEETEFWTGCTNGDYDSVLKILEKKPSLLQKLNPSYNYNSIHFVVYKGHYGLTRALVEQYPHLVNMVSSIILDSTVGKAYPIHIACNRGYGDILKLLIENKADLRCEDSGAYSPLGVALTSGNYECAKILIKRGANVLYHHTIPTYSTNNLIHSIIDPDLMDLFIKNGLDPNYINPITGNTILHSTITTNQLKCAEVLLSAGCHVDQANFNGDTPLHFAITLKLINIVKPLIKYRADCNARNGAGNIPSQLAVFHSSYAVLNVLLEESNLNITPSGQATVPFQLVERVNAGCEIDILKALKTILGYGYPVNEVDQQGMTMLQIAARNTQCPTSIIELLLSHYADPNTTDISKNTPLHYVCKSNQKQNIEKVKALLESSADPNSQNSIGHSPLHQSVISYNVATTQCLISYGGDFLLKDNQGKSSLQVMMKIPVFKTLVEGIKETNPDLDFETFENLPNGMICPSIGKIVCWQCGAQPTPMCYYLNNSELNREDNFRVLGYSAVCFEHKEFGDRQPDWIFVSIE